MLGRKLQPSVVFLLGNALISTVYFSLWPAGDQTLSPKDPASCAEAAKLWTIQPQAQGWIWYTQPMHHSATYQTLDMYLFFARLWKLPSKQAQLVMQIGFIRGCILWNHQGCYMTGPGGASWHSQRDVAHNGVSVMNLPQQGCKPRFASMKLCDPFAFPPARAPDLCQKYCCLAATMLHWRKRMQAPHTWLPAKVCLVKIV